MDLPRSADRLALFEPHHEDLKRFFARKLGCPHLAADCAQETYLHMARMDPAQDIRNPRALLFRVAANLAIDHLRKAKSQAAVISQEPAPPETRSATPSAEDELDAKQRVQRLDRAIGELKPNCRQALLLNRLDGWTHADIARRLGVSESMVAKYIVQALKHCRAHVEQS